MDNLTYLEIRNLVARFDDAVNRRDPDEFSKLWAKDSTWDIGEPRPSHLKGEDMIVSTWQSMMDATKWLFRGTFEGVLEEKEGTIHGRWPCVETGVFTTDEPYDNRAFYDDVYVLEDGKWCFKSRSYVYLWISGGALPGQSYPANS